MLYAGKTTGQETNSSPYHDTVDLYNFEYKLESAYSLLDRAKIDPQGKQKIVDWRRLRMGSRQNA